MFITYLHNHFLGTKTSNETVSMRIASKVGHLLHSSSSLCHASCHEGSISDVTQLINYKQADTKESDDEVHIDW